MDPEINDFRNAFVSSTFSAQRSCLGKREAHMLWYVGRSVMAAQRFAQLRTKMPGTEETVLSTLQSEGWYAGMT